jgi:hypothetical protein
MVLLRACAKFFQSSCDLGPNAKRNGRYDNSDFQHDQDMFWSAQLEHYPQYILFHYALHRNKPHHILHLAALATAGFDGGRGTYSRQRSW